MSDLFSDDDNDDADSAHAQSGKQRRFTNQNKKAKRQKRATASLVSKPTQPVPTNANEASVDRSGVVTADVLSFQTLLAQRETALWTEERSVDRVITELTAIRDIKSLYESIGRGADYRLDQDQQNDDRPSDDDHDKKLADTDTDVWIM
jgi:hypothetical protein